MDLTGVAALRRSLPSASPAGTRGRRRPSRVSCCIRGRFAEEGHLKYYEAGAAPRKAAVEAVARDLAKIRAMGLVAGDAAKEKVLSEATDLLLQALDQMKDDEYIMKKVRKEEKAAMKSLKQQQKEAKKAAAMMSCEDGSSSESSESDCEEEQIMRIGQGTAMSTAAPEVSVSRISTVAAIDCEKAAMKAMKKMEKEQKKAAKKAMKMKKKAEKMAMAAVNGCRDEDSSSESSESECEGEVVRMSRCATITTAPEEPAPSTVFPIIIPQIPESVSPDPSQEHRVSSEPPASATQCTTSTAVVAMPMANRIEVCMGGKCKKSGSLALLQEFEKEVGTEGAVVGCKCLGKCGLGPNVRLRSESSVEGSVKKNPLYIGVGLEDVGTVVAGLFGDGDLGVTPA